MYWCPLKECGRKFVNENALVDHIKRRHKAIDINVDKIKSDNIRNLIESNGSLSVDFKSLPKMKKLTEGSFNKINLTLQKDRSSQYARNLTTLLKLFSESMTKGLEETVSV